MQTTHHTQHLARLTRLRAVNAFLVVEDDGLTLVDTMIPGSRDGILEAARGLGAPIVRIALTHAHGDHVGSLDALAEALPQAEVSISARDARLLGGDRTLDPGEPPSKLRGYPTTRSKPGREPGGLALVRAVVEAVRLPIIAIGGIDERNVAAVIGAGAYGVAVMSAILCAPAPAVVVARLLEIIGREAAWR